ncbi:MAG: sigma-70 family RNA polymerase sigma factor [Ktedonobacteraceae bacterium]|nr:sigma-70 family RNA polymerase sigma factor [Ktedonobacteraceae bacterium]
MWKQKLYETVIGHAKELEMSDQEDDLQSRVRAVAEKAIQAYAQGILLLDALAERISREWERIRKGDTQPPHDVLVRIAQRICSRELYNAWRTSDMSMRNSAFYNIRRYLEYSLVNTRYASLLRNVAHAEEDVVHQTLEILLDEETKGPNDPAAFLKWIQTILIRQARAYVQRWQRGGEVSLDAQMELLQERLVDHSDGADDPLEHILLQELHEALGKAILSMRNPNYRLVLVYTYLVGVDEDELAQRLQVAVQDIYLWRHRALKTLRRNQEIMRILRSLLE